MSYSLSLHPQVRDDVLEIFLKIDENSPIQADKFAESVIEEYEKLLYELNNHVYKQNIRQVKSRPVGKFKRHLIFYTVDKTEEQVMVLAVVYGGMNPDSLNEMIDSRL